MVGQALAQIILRPYPLLGQEGLKPLVVAADEL
jgi:hypothetical protein